MLTVIGLSNKLGDKFVDVNGSIRSAQRQARKLCGPDYQVVRVMRDACGYCGELVAEYSYFPACTHTRVDEDVVVMLGGACPICGQDWLAKEEKIKTY